MPNNVGVKHVNEVNPLDHVVISFKKHPNKQDAIDACIAWFDAEEKHLGSPHYRMELCNYSEWACRKVAGQNVGDYEGVPRLVITRG